MASIPPVRKRIRNLHNATSVIAGATCNPLQNDLHRIECEYLPIDQLKPPKRALRKHGKKNLKQLRAAIAEFGFNVPIIVDANDRIISGFGRWLAAKDRGMREVPVVRISHLTPEQIRAFAIADNQLGTLSAWDDDILNEELSELLALDLSGALDFHIESTGFSTAEIDLRLEMKNTSSGAENEEPEEVLEPEALAICQPGEVYHLGTHRLICGNSLETGTYEALLGDERAQMVFADSPYNVEIIGNVTKNRKHREFAFASGEMSRDEFIRFLTAIFLLLVRFSVNGSIHYQCIDWRHILEMQIAGEQAYTELKNLCVWVKENAGMGTFYRSQHELVFVFKNGDEPHINNFGLGETGRWRSNVWRYPGSNSFQKGRDELLEMHSTVKNLSMVADAIRDCSKTAGIILDPFGGSGTTLIAAEKTGRRARLIEIDPLYCDVIIRRWQKLTGQRAVMIETGQTFDELAAIRAAEAGMESGHD